MYTNLSTQLAATTTATYSQAVSMDGANAASIDCVIYKNTGANNLDVTLQGSNDLQNWEDIGSAAEEVSESTPGSYIGSPITDIGHAYVRLKCAVETSGTVVCSVGIQAFES